MYTEYAIVYNGSNRQGIEYLIYGFKYHFAQGVAKLGNALPVMVGVSIWVWL